MSAEEFGEEIFKLQRFNMNAKKLKESQLMGWFRENSLKIDFLIEKKSPRSAFPPDPYFELFLLIFQKCITDDQSSVSAISKIYKNLDLKKNLKTRFSDFQEGLNRCLDSRPFKEIIKVGKEIRDLTLINVMDVFLYGEFLHDHPKKAELYNKISQNIQIREFYWFEFYMLIYKCALIIFHIMLLNESLLKDLQGKDNI